MIWLVGVSRVGSKNTKNGPEFKVSETGCFFFPQMYLELKSSFSSRVGKSRKCGQASQDVIIIIIIVIVALSALRVVRVCLSLTAG